MEEKILNTRKNGMAMLLLTLLGYVASIALFIFCITLLNADRLVVSQCGIYMKREIDPAERDGAAPHAVLW